MGKSPGEAANARLSRRETEIARLVAEGLTNREIAARLFISERTVDGHLEHVREKLGVNSRAQIAAWVVRQGSADENSPMAAPASRPASPHGQERLRLWLAAALIISVLALGAGELGIQPGGPSIVTVAGSEQVDKRYVDGGYSGDGYRAISAQLNRPSDLAVAPHGVIYIADYGNHRVRMVDAGGIITTVAGGGKLALTDGALATNVELGYPSNVATDGTGQLYILTNVDQILQVWTLDATDTFVTHIVSLPSSGNLPSPNWPDPVGGLAVASDGTLYISDRPGNTVWRFNPTTGLSRLVGTGEPSLSGDTGPLASAGLDSPVGLALDEKRGYLYVADSGNNRIRRIELTRGIITTVAGSGDTYGDSGDGGLAVEARLSIPFGVAVARDGTVYIADTGNNRLRKLVGGRILAVAGTGTWGFAGDNGPAILARLSGPGALTFDADGNLLVADTFNQRVRILPGVSP
jgi:DNA-binding CsgD family transcriptional regulator/sugar lactone lactonase YvrE